MELSDPLPLKCGCDSTTGDKCPSPWNMPHQRSLRCDRALRGGRPAGRCGVRGTRHDVLAGDRGASAGGTGSGGSAARALAVAVVAAGTGGSAGAAASGDGDDGGCGCRALGSSAAGRSVFAAVGVLIGIGLIRVFRRRR